MRVPDPASALRARPHEFSGGLRQRIALAVALACEPKILLADEPTTALDVTVQAEILRLMRQLVDERQLSVVLISHDLGVVSSLADRVQVMYAGRIMESARTGDLFYQTKHPYTRALQKSIPALQIKGKELYTIAGAPPDLLHPLSGCPFAPRCDYAVDGCEREEVAELEVAPAHCSACLRVQKEKLTL